MKLYRVMRKLMGKKGVIEKGSAITLSWLNEEQIARLELRGAVSEISAPPLSEMPLPKSAKAKMKRAKMDDAADLLMGSDAELAKALKVGKATAAKWRDEVARLLMVKPPERG